MRAEYIYGKVYMVKLTSITSRKRQEKTKGNDMETTMTETKTIIFNPLPTIFECPNCGTMLSCANCPILIEREDIFAKLDIAELEVNQLKRKLFDLREMVMGWTPPLEAFLTRLVDRKDQYTHAHSQRVTE